MPTRNVHLTSELDQYIDDSIRSGRYENASEVIRAGLRALAQSEAEDRARVEALRTAIQEGFDSGIAEGDAIGRLRGVIQDRAGAKRRRSA